MLYEKRNTATTITRRKFNAISIRGVTDFPHRHIEGRKITCAKSSLASLVVGHMLKVFNSCSFTEKVTYLSSAFA